MFKLFKNKIKRHIDAEISRVIEERMNNDEFITILLQMQQFYSAPDEMLSSKVEALTKVDNLVDRFGQLGVTVKKVTVDVNDFENWVKKYPEMHKQYSNHGDVKIEKLLEHYLTTHHLNLEGGGTYIDIAAASSPFAEIVQKTIGCKAYSQDLIFEDGINGNKIGGDAGKMPIPDNFANVMTLHCAYECFQGDSDIRFIKEAGRVLSSDGRLGIIPLYMDDVYFVKTGPKCDKRKVSVEPEARWIWRDDEYKAEPFSRHYSPESFKSRIIDNMINMNYEILYFTNLADLRKKYFGQRIYCNFMFRVFK